MLCLVADIALSQGLPEAMPEEVGISGERLDRISPVMQGYIEQKVYAGMEAGELVLEEPDRPVTILDLLTHTSGLSYGLFSNTPVDSLIRKSGMWFGDLEHMADALGPIPLLFQPGDHWHYSLATDVLGYLVEVVSGQAFDSFLRERLFEPLGMDDTDFFVPEEKMDRVMPVFYMNEKGALEARSLSRIPKASPKFLSGGGGLYSTISDYARFAQMILNGGELEGARLLAYKSVDFMLSNQLSEEQMKISDISPGLGFGLGFSVLEDLPSTGNIGSKGAAGWSGINNTFFTVDPGEDLLFILMTQFSPYNIERIRKHFSTLVYQALTE
jgi:CubicO group peptidase (beta-lactamase class C family)